MGRDGELHSSTEIPYCLPTESVASKKSRQNQRSKPCFQNTAVSEWMQRAMGSSALGEINP